jgi:DNA-binding FadR family transcriptional regulator
VAEILAARDIIEQRVHRAALGMAAHHDVCHLKNVDREFHGRRGGIGLADDAGRRDNIADILYHEKIAGLALRDQLREHA